MIISTIIGVSGGLFVGLRTPLPYWRLLGGYVALAMIVTGIDLIAWIAPFPNLPKYFTSSKILWMSLGGGALIGAGTGYFARLIWLKVWQRNKHGPMNTGNQVVAPKE